MLSCHEFYADFVQRYLTPVTALLPAKEPDWFLEYFLQRGIRYEMISEAQAIPLTPRPLHAECEASKRYLKTRRTDDKSGAPDWIQRGILFPFWVDPVEYGEFGQARVFDFTARALAYYQQTHQDAPKMFSPKKERVKAAAHLYILPSEAAKLATASVDLTIIEGQAKTLKLIQDLRTAGLADQYAVVGITGADMLLASPEAHTLPWRNRGVYLFFDADSLRKPGVAQAELKAAAFCLSKGVKWIKACGWKEERGNGYDDHSVYAEQNGFPPSVNLPNLFKKAKDPFERHAPTEEKPGVPIDVMCRAIAKVPTLLKHQRTVLLSKITKLYRVIGLKPKDVSEIFTQQLEHIRQQQQTQRLQEHGEQLKQLFDVPYVPDMPENFYLREGYLYATDTPLCRVFVIKKYIAAEDAEQQHYYLLAFRGKEVLIPSDMFTNYRKIAEIFNRNQEILCDESARHVQKFIAQYWIKNQHKPIPVVTMFANTGWDKTGVFRIPSRDGENEYSYQIKHAFTCAGDPERQRAFIRTLMLTQPAAVLFLLGFLTPMVGLLGLKPMIVMIYGNPGDGKSTAAFAALSLYGFWEKLYQSMNATKVGKEVACAMSKDLPVLFDELNTAGDGDGKVLAQQMLSTIYGFHSGKGRTRSTIQISLAKQNEYQGLLMMTSERSLASIFSVMTNLNIGGAYRRTLEIPVLHKHALWEYADAERESFFKGIYENISRDYGYVGAAWLDYLSDAAIQTAIKQDYKTALQDLGARGVELKGTDHLIALIEAICPHVETFLDIPPGRIWGNVSDYVNLMIDQQQRQINFQVRNTTEKFVDALNAFIAGHPTMFDGICPDSMILPKVYGKVLDHANQTRHVYLRPEGLQELCNTCGFDRNGILEQLREEQILKPWRVTENTVEIERDYKPMRIRQTGGNAYRFVIPAPETFTDAALLQDGAPPAAPDKPAEPAEPDWRQPDMPGMERRAQWRDHA